MSREGSHELSMK